MTKLFLNDKNNLKVEDSTLVDYFTHIGERAVIYNKKINKEIEGLDKFNNEQKKIFYIY